MFFSGRNVFIFFSLPTPLLSVHPCLQYSSSWRHSGNPRSSRPGLYSVLFFVQNCSRQTSSRCDDRKNNASTERNDVSPSLERNKHSKTNSGRRTVYNVKFVSALTIPALRRARATGNETFLFRRKTDSAELQQRVHGVAVRAVAVSATRGRDRVRRREQVPPREQRVVLRVHARRRPAAGRRPDGAGHLRHG